MEDEPRRSIGCGKPEVEERLKRISQALIEAYKAKDAEFILGYARQAGIAPSVSGAPLNRLFGRVIQVYHPDRIGAVMERLSAAGGAKAFLALREFRRRPAGPLPAGNAGRYDSEHDLGGEDYGYGEDDFGYAEGDFGYAEMDADSPAEEGGFGEVEESMDILEAVKRAFLGNLDAYPTQLELEELEGDLDLSGMDISDAEGAQWLKSVSGLNLAGNRIDNCAPLAGMQRLESLDLSDNLLEDADALAELEFLSELDLSGNDIEDFSFLDRLPALRYANLSGNPPIPRALREGLRAKGVVVVQ